jgi:hypothetical protein
MADVNGSTKDLEELLSEVDNDLNEMQILFSSLERLGFEIVDKIAPDYAWMGTALKSMSVDGQGIAGRCLEKYMPTLRHPRARAGRRADPVAPGK